MLQGQLDDASHKRISGWAQETETPDVPVALLVTANATMVARVVARTWRADLAEAGVGTGWHAFEVNPGAMLAGHTRWVIAVRRESDGAHISGSPTVLQPASTFDDATREGFATLLASADTAEELESRVDYLVRLTDRLLQERGDVLSQRVQRARQHFAWRWPQAHGGVASTTSVMGLPRRALVIDETMPRTGHDAGANVVLSHMASLRRLGFAVTFAAADLVAHDPGPLEAVGASARLPPWHASIEEVLRREAATFDLVYLHRIGIASRYLPLVRHYQPKARLVFSVADLSWLRIARQATVEDRPELQTASRALRAQEVLTAMGADAVLTHSTQEAALLRQDGVPANKIHLVRWASRSQPTEASFRKRRGVAFIGGFAHHPNVDAAHWLVETIMPLVWQADARIACLLVGSEMPATLRRIEHPNVQIIGHVPILSRILNRVRLTVAPLRFGAGVKGKVVDSFAHAIPCLCTPIAAEGLDLPEDLQTLIRRSPQELAQHIITLHNDPLLNRKLGRTAQAYVSAAFSEAALDASLRLAFLGAH